MSIPNEVILEGVVSTKFCAHFLFPLFTPLYFPSRNYPRDYWRVVNSKFIQYFNVIPQSTGNSTIQEQIYCHIRTGILIYNNSSAHAFQVQPNCRKVEMESAVWQQPCQSAELNNRQFYHVQLCDCYIGRRIQSNVQLSLTAYKTGNRTS